MTSDTPSSFPALPAETADVETDRLDEIMADPTLTVEQKREYIQSALEDIAKVSGEERASPYEPLESRFFDALSLLADGGHDYADRSEDEEASETDRLTSETDTRL